MKSILFHKQNLCVEYFVKTFLFVTYCYCYIVKVGQGQCSTHDGRVKQVGEPLLEMFNRLLLKSLFFFLLHCRVKFFAKDM